MNSKRARRQTETSLARLVFLARAVEAFGIPVREAERLVLPPDLPWFVKGLEKRVRAIGKLFDDYLIKHPGALRRGDDPENEYVVEQELAYARKSLSFITRIGKTVVEVESTTAFAAEKEELRRMREGKLKIDPPADSKRPQP
jgi:hypothetical protein